MKGTDVYLVEINGALTAGYSTVLAQLYAALIGVNAVNLYNIMVGEAFSGQISDINKLLKLSSINIDEFELAIQSLEKCELMESYVKRDENLYLFVLQSPLAVEQFLQHDVYGHLYLDKVGKKVFDSVKETLLKRHQTRSYFENITHKMDSVLTNWSNVDNLNYENIKYVNPNDEKYIFDIKEFLREYGAGGTQRSLIPEQLRTDENLATIASLGTTFAISQEDMAKYLTQCIDVNNSFFDVKTLRSKCLGSRKIEIADIEDEYQLPPIAFLYKRRGVKVAGADKLFLERCQNEYYLKREVINVLIEATLKYNENRFPIKYAEKMASEWAAIKIDTKEKAMAEAENKNTQAKSSGKAKQVYTLDEMQVEQADIEAIRKQLFKKG